MKRAVLLAVCAAVLFAGPEEDAWNLVARLATDLSANNGVEFLAHIDPKMPGYETLYNDVLALTREAALSSSIDPISNRGDDRNRTLEVDWIMELTGRDNSAVFQRRHEKVKLQMKKEGRHWRVVGLEPLRFFRPA